MDDLRSEIRAAFEREQATDPVPGGLRSNLTSAAATQVRPAPNLQWIAVAVAAALGVLVVAGLLSTRHTPRASVPAATPNATPLVDYGPPPAGVPLLYVHDPNDPSWLIAFDWSGKPRGTVKLQAAAAQDPSAVKMAPDGSGFEVGGTYKGGTGTFLDRLGQPVATETGSTGLVGAMWADDNQHQCVLSLSPTTYVWRLATQLPGQAPRPVAVIAKDPSIGQSGISLTACSFRSDRAIAVRTVIAWPAELWVIRLSDGAILAHHSYAASGQLVSVVGSADGKYVAESAANGQGVGSSKSATSTVIRRVSDWQVVKKFDPLVQVLRFSGDGALALVSESVQPNSLQATLKILNWSTGSTVWQRDLSNPSGFALTVQTNGRDFAFADVTLGGPDLKATISIVHGDGSVTKLSQSYEAAW
jgi:hypothetical protein